MTAAALARFEGIRPAVVARCASAADVTDALASARRSGLDVAVRSGGHCFAGRSSTRGLLIDVGPMSGVTVDGGLAVVGAGALLADVYDALAPHGVTIAAGCGPDVGIAGLTLGGGLGILGRTHGLTCDQLVWARVVLADGRVVECDEHQHADLFWALRGAGGGQFGVVTRFAFRTVPAPTTTVLHLTWPLECAAGVIATWQDWAPDAPDEVAASLLLTAADGPPVVHCFGTCPPDLIGDLVAAVGTRPSSREVRALPFREAKRWLAEYGPGDEPVEPVHLYGKSEFFRGTLPPDALLDHFANGPAVPRALDFSPWGGAYNRVPADATAFPHRAERFLLKHDLMLPAGCDPSAALAWLRESWALAHPYGSGSVYPNFPDPDLDDPARAYHGANLERLRRAKAAYDPDNVFRFPQSITA